MNDGAPPASAERVPDDWFVGFHRGLAARFWRAAAAGMTDADAPLVLELLDLPCRGRVLDVPCGDGRLTLRLAAAGHDAVGLDIVPDEVEHARSRAAAARSVARFAVGDLRALPDVGTVDGVVSWGNSFGYLVPEETAAALAGLRAALRPGGRLVLESATVAESLLPGGVAERRELEFGAIRMNTTSTYRPEESRLESAHVFTDADGRVEHARAAHHVHTTGELVRLLRAAGFGEISLRGPAGRTPYALGARRLVAVAVAA